MQFASHRGSSPRENIFCKHLFYIFIGLRTAVGVQSNTDDETNNIGPLDFSTVPPFFSEQHRYYFFKKTKIEKAVLEGPKSTTNVKDMKAKVKLKNKIRSNK